MISLETLKIKFNKYLEEYWYKKYKSRFSNHLLNAIEYSLFSGGKRIRPVMVLVASSMYDNENALRVGVAIEMIHTYSLIHDDLPSMDNDDYRRGKLTCHRKFNEGIAILAGNMLYNEAFRILADINDGLVKKAVDKLGIEGLIGGQALDIKKNIQYDKDDILLIHKYKTGALMSLSLSLGGIIAGLKDVEINKLDEIGYNLGIAFQIIDDILDFKKGQIDTYNIVNVVNNIEIAKQLTVEYTDKTITMIEELHNDLLKDLAYYLLERKI